MNAKQVHQDTIYFKNNYLIAKVAALKLRLPQDTLVKWKASYEEGLYDVEKIEPENDVPVPPIPPRQRCELINIDIQ